MIANRSSGGTARMTQNPSTALSALPRTPCSLLPVIWGERTIIVDVSPMTVDEYRARAIAMLEAHIAWGEMVFPFIKANSKAQERDSVS